MNWQHVTKDTCLLNLIEYTSPYLQDSSWMIGQHSDNQTYLAARRKRLGTNAGVMPGLSSLRTKRQ